MPPSQPDLVLVMTDQQRHDHVGWWPGSPVRTPHLDALAASGVVFEAGYSASTTCVPARTSLMTGLLDHRTPYRERWALEQDFFTVPHALRAAGYQTALIGKMHFNPMRSSHGFEHVRVVEHLSAYAADPRSMELASVRGGERTAARKASRVCRAVSSSRERHPAAAAR